MFSSINKTFGCCSKIFGCSNKKFVLPNFVAVTKPFFSVKKIGGGDVLTLLAGSLSLTVFEVTNLEYDCGSACKISLSPVNS